MSPSNIRRRDRACLCKCRSNFCQCGIRACAVALCRDADTRALLPSPQVCQRPGGGGGSRRGGAKSALNCLSAHECRNALDAFHRCMGSVRDPYVDRFGQQPLSRTPPPTASRRFGAPTRRLRAHLFPQVSQGIHRVLVERARLGGDKVIGHGHDADVDRRAAHQPRDCRLRK